MNRNRIIMVLLLGGLSMFSIGCTNLGKDKTWTENIKYDNVESIEIDVSSANVKFIPESREDILVEFDTYENGDELLVRESKNVLIQTKSKHVMGINMSADYELRVYVPESFSGDLTIEVSSGNVEIDDATLDKVKFNMSSGNVEGENLVCNILETDISSGNVELKGFEGAIDGHSSSGNFILRYKSKMNDLKYTSSSGNVDIYYGDMQIDGTFELTTTSGDVDMELKLEDILTKKENKVVGSNGEGTYNIDIGISSGDIGIFE